MESLVAAPPAPADCFGAIYSSAAQCARRQETQQMEGAAAGAYAPQRRRGCCAARARADGDGDGDGDEAQESLHVPEDGERFWQVQQVSCVSGVSLGWRTSGQHGEEAEEAAAGLEAGDGEVDCKHSRQQSSDGCSSSSPRSSLPSPPCSSSSVPQGPGYGEEGRGREERLKGEIREGGRRRREEGHHVEEGHQRVPGRLTRWLPSRGWVEGAGLGGGWWRRRGRRGEF